MHYTERSLVKVHRIAGTFPANSYLPGPLMSRDCAAHIKKITEVTMMLQGKWKLEILCAMRDEPVRLSQLTRLLPDASKKSLRASLRDLEAAQIVVRRDLSDTVLHVEYEFADHLKEPVGSLLDQLARWGEIIEAEKSRLLQ